MSGNEQDHGWVHERIAAAVAGGLSGEEQGRFDAHVHGCAECFDAFTEARDADRRMGRALDALAPASGGSVLEERLVAAFREQAMKRQGHSVAKRAGWAVAAAVALGATGVFAQYVVRGDLLNNAVSKRLAGTEGVLPLPGFIDRAENPARGMAAGMSDARTLYSFNIKTPKDQDDAKRDGGRATRGLLEPVAAAGQRFAGGEKAPFDIAASSVSLASKDSSSRGGYGGRSSGRATGGGDASRQDVYFSLEDKAEKEVSANHGQSNGQFAAQTERKLGEQIAAGEKPALRTRDDAPALNAAPDVMSAPGDGPPATTAPARPSPAATEIAEHKIIRNGTVEFEVRSFDDAAATIASVVGEEGGYVSSTSSEKLANGKVRGTVSLRVPPEHLDRMLLKLRALGELKSQQIGASDVTKEYTDLESELRALRAMESRLIDIIKTGNGQVKDLVVAEKQLGEYRIRIEKIEGQIRYYNNLVAMATLTITAYEKDIQTPTAAQEQENVTLSVEAEDVEAKYADARKAIVEAGGRVVESELKKHDAGQYAAHIVAEVEAGKADLLVVGLKQLGTVAEYNRDRKQTTTGGAGAPTVEVEQKPTRISLSLYNLANIAPRETSMLRIAVKDVEGAYRAVLQQVRRPANGSGEKEGAVRQIVTSALNGQQPEQMMAEIRADVPAGSAEELLQALRGMGEVMASTVTENPDTRAVTAAKRGIQVYLVPVVSVAARESRTMSLVAEGVPEAYGKLVAAVQGMEGAGKAHLQTSTLNQSDPRTVTASLAFDVAREALPEVEKAFAEAGVETLSRNVSHSTDTANTLDSKVHFQITELKSADALAPQRTTTMGVETENVERAMGMLRGELEKDHARNVQYSVSREASGRVTGRLTVDVPVGDVVRLLGQIRDVGGEEKVNQVVDNPEVPTTRFATERVDLTLVSREALVGEDRGIGATVRAALGSAAAALLWSLYLIVTGVLFVGPWLVIAWVGWKLTRRRAA